MVATAICEANIYTIAPRFFCRYAYVGMVVLVLWLYTGNHHKEKIEHIVELCAVAEKG